MCTFATLDVAVFSILAAASACQGNTKAVLSFVQSVALTLSKVAWTGRSALRLWTDHRNDLTRTIKMINMPDIQLIKSTITIDRVLADYGVPAPKVSGKGRVTACPVHGASEQSRAFRISADGRAWYCFGACQKGGSVIDLVMLLEGCGARKAAEIIAARFGVG